MIGLPSGLVLKLRATSLRVRQVVGEKIAILREMPNSVVLRATASFVLGMALPIVFWQAAINLPDSGEAIAAEQVKPEIQVQAIQVAAIAPSQSDGRLPGASNLERMGYRPVIDTAIESIYQSLSDNNLNQALRDVDLLLEEFPNFSLAHLLRGDILSLKAGRSIGAIGDIRRRLPKDKQEELSKLREEAVARFKAVRDRPAKDLLPSELMVLDNQQAYVILVDTSRSRLFLYENSFPHPRLVTDFYISQGKKGAVKVREGDKRTPIGVYTITELLPKEKLTDFYGPIALPIDYPNRWDKRLGKTGYGIWLHGMPQEFVSRPPKDSDGCVVLANQDLLELKKFVDIGNTQVIISENLDFVPSDLWQVQRRSALRVVKSWKDDLEKGLEAGLAHYAQDVLIDGRDLLSWQKDQELYKKQFGSISIQNLTVVKYPFEDKDMMRITFEQSDDINGRQRKEQFWIKAGTRWQIVQEDSVQL